MMYNPSDVAREKKTDWVWSGEGLEIGFRFWGTPLVEGIISRNLVALEGCRARHGSGCACKDCATHGTPSAVEAQVRQSMAHVRQSMAQVRQSMAHARQSTAHVRQSMVHARQRGDLVAFEGCRARHGSGRWRLLSVWGVGVPRTARIQGS
jgi:hypothetical protein